MFLRKIILFITVCFLVLTHTLSAQITVQGVVRDNAAEPVANAKVELIDQADNSRVFSSTTDSQGHYAIQITDTGISPELVRVPQKFNLLQNYPNPFNPSTVISYQIPYPAHVRIEIYNVLGQKVRTLFDGYQSNLYGRIIWDATNDRNMGVAAGVYIYTLVSDDYRVNRKMLLLDGHLGNTGVTSSATTTSTQPVLSKAASNPYLLRVSGMDIINKELYDLQITGNMEQDVTVIRAGSMIDIDGNVYKTVKIGEQVWMAENLRVTHYRNGEPIPNIIDNSEWSNLTTGAYCYYDNSNNFMAEYGALYNWYAVNDSRNIAPAGWHVPTDAEWKQLEMIIGMPESAANDIGFRWTDEGDKLKETGITYWASPNNWATNESGFSARGAGWRILFGDFSGMKNSANFWTANESDVMNAWIRELNTYSTILRDVIGKSSGFSVRLVKD